MFFLHHKNLPESRAIFRADLEEGPVKMETELMNAGSISRGAYYVYVKYLNE